MTAKEELIEYLKSLTPEQTVIALAIAEKMLSGEGINDA